MEEMSELCNSTKQGEQPATTSDLAEPLKCEDVEVDRLPEEMELNKVYETIGVGPAQYIFWVISFLIAYSDYAELTLIALIIPYLRCEWELSEQLEATITVTVFLVYAISAMVCGKISDIYGRKRLMSITIVILIMYFCNIFIETAVLVFLPLAYISEFCGAKGEAPQRDECQKLTQSDLWKLSGAAAGSLAGCWAAYFVAKCLGRLKPTRGSNILQIAAFGFMFKCFNNDYLFGVSTAIKVINAFICMMIWFIIPESFPTLIRNTATGMVNSSGKIGAVVGTAIVYLLFYASPVSVVISFVVVSCLTCICSFLLKKETQDVELMDT